MDVNINTTSEDKIRMIPDSLCQSRHPNMYFMGLDADLSKRKKDTVTAFVLVNLSDTENLRLRKNTVVGFAEKDDIDGEVFQVETLDTTPRNWTNLQTLRTFAQFVKKSEETGNQKIDTDVDLHKVFTSALNFIKSPAEVEMHRKVDLEDKIIKEETKERFHNLIGEFHPASSKGNRYALTAICMLTGFTFCIPLKNKTAEEVVKAYLNHICCVFGPSKKMLTDNGTEFKNKMWEDMYKLLRTQHRVTPIYSPQCNSGIEGFHRFLKATVGK